MKRFKLAAPLMIGPQFEDVGFVLGPATYERLKTFSASSRIWNCCRAGEQCRRSHYASPLIHRDS
jgi:hypothetical protein